MAFGAPAIGSLVTPMISGSTGGAGAGSGVGAGGIGGLGGGQGVGGASPTDKAGNGFGDVLKSKLTELTDSQAAADKASQDIATNRSADVAGSLLQVEKANITLQTATQVRNKVIEAYQDVLRMQM